MAIVITLRGIDGAISKLNYQNKTTLKYRFIHAIKGYYPDESKIRSLEGIEADELVKALWDTADDPAIIRNKRKNLSTLKSAVNADLKRLYDDGENPEGITIGPTNIFVMSDQAKEKLLTTFTGEFGNENRRKGEITLEQIEEVLHIVNEILSDAEALADRDGLDGTNNLENLRNLVRGLSGNLGLEGKEGVSNGGLAERNVGDDDEQVDEDEVVEEATSGDESAAEEEIEAEEIDEDEAVEEVDEDLEAGEADEGIEEVEADDNLEETENEDGGEQVDEDEVVEEAAVVDESEAEEGLEGDEIDEDEVEEDVEDAEVDDDLEVAEVADDAEIADQDIDEAVEDLEEVEAVAAAEEGVEVVEVDEDEILEDSEGLEETDEDEGDYAGEGAAFEDLGQYYFDERDQEENKIDKARVLAEDFNAYLSARERSYNEHILISGGTYTVGSKDPKNDERPEDKVRLASFYIGRFPVTNTIFQVFVERTGYKTTAERLGHSVVYTGRVKDTVDEESGLLTSACNAGVSCRTVHGACWYQPAGPGSTLHGKRNHPVVHVSLEDAMAFAAWTGKRLPTEKEWEAAARGVKGLVFPWGNDWKDGTCNIEESAVADTTPVEKYMEFASDFGILDTIGNVLEWTLDNCEPPSQVTSSSSYRIVKGGSWISGKDIRLFSRFKCDAESSSNILGFRCIAF